MGNTRRIRVRATSDLAEAWEQEVRRQVASSRDAVGEVRVRVPLLPSVGVSTLIALAAVLSRADGWEEDVDGVFRRVLAGGHIAFDPATCELEIAAREPAEPSPGAVAGADIPGIVEAEGAGAYYDDGWGGSAGAAAQRAVEQARDRLHSDAAEAHRNQARQPADDESADAVRDRPDAALPSAKDRTEELGGLTAEDVVAVGIEGRALFHQVLADAYRDAILAFAREKGADSIRYTDSGGVLDIEFRTADLGYQEAGGGVRTRFRYRPVSGEVELFEVEDLQAGPASASDDARLEEAVADVARIVERDADINIYEVYPEVSRSLQPGAFPVDVAASAQAEGANEGVSHWAGQAPEPLARERAADRPGGGGVPGDGARGPDDAPARRRYLKGQCPEIIAVGEPFSLLASVVLTGPARAALKPFSVPSGGRDVLLVAHAPGLRLLGRQRMTVRVPPDQDSEPVMFELAADVPGPRRVSVTAWLGGSYLGELIVEIAAERGRPSGPHRDVLAEIATEPVDGAVSLVVRYDPVQKAYRFEFRDEDNPDEVTSNLVYDPGPLVEQLLADLDELAKGRSGYSAAQTRDYLVNAGAGLWRELVPPRLREQFWERQHRIRQLTILTDKDAVPWEVLYPMDPGHDAGFLVDQFPVTRAVFGRRPSRQLSLSPARFVLPEGSPPEARDEIEAIRRLLDPDQPPGAVISALTPLQDLIRNGDFGLLHFACHNTYNPVGGSSITLDKRQFTCRHMNTAAIGQVLARSAPTVFINACRSAGKNPTYNRLDGWADKFLEAGAAAFIGSLWAVSDRTASEFAGELYGQLRAGSSLGKAVMQARQAAAGQPGDPSWLAYTVYGDPRAAVSQPLP